MAIYRPEILPGTGIALDVQALALTSLERAEPIRRFDAFAGRHPCLAAETLRDHETVDEVLLEASSHDHPEPEVAEFFSILYTMYTTNVDICFDFDHSTEEALRGLYAQHLPSEEFRVARIQFFLDRLCLSREHTLTIPVIED